jgi:hypothetical protein
MKTPVKEDQFEISDKGIKHTPTGYEFIPHPGQPFSGNVHLGHHGNKLPSGEDYDPSEESHDGAALECPCEKERAPDERLNVDPMKPKQPAGPPMTRANMRELGEQRLVAYCLNDACRHPALIDVSKYPGGTEVPWFRPKGKMREVRQQKC